MGWDINNKYLTEQSTHNKYRESTQELMVENKRLKADSQIKTKEMENLKNEVKALKTKNNELIEKNVKQAEELQVVIQTAKLEKEEREKDKRGKEALKSESTQKDESEAKSEDETAAQEEGESEKIDS